VTLEESELETIPL